MLSLKNPVPCRRILPLPVFLALAILSITPKPAFANGWEHAAIPFEALIWGLGDAAAETRARAAESLGHRGQREAVPFLLDALGGQARAPLKVFEQDGAPCQIRHARQALADAETSLGELERGG